MKPEGLSPYSQEPATCFYPVSDRPSYTKLHFWMTEQTVHGPYGVDVRQTLMHLS
jgi:hypothetical protein